MVSSSVPPTAYPVSTTAAPQHVGTLWVSWAVIIAGALAAIAVQVGLTELCVSAGLALYEPGDPDSSGTAVTAGTVIAIAICGLVSVFIGGWVAGRMKRHSSRIEAAVHGGLVWALGSVLTMILATVTVGAVASGAMSLVGKGLSAAASGAGALAEGVADMAAPAVKQMAGPTWDAMRKQVESAFERNDSNPASGEGDDASRARVQNRYVERSRLMQLLGKTFSFGDDATSLTQAEEEELRTLLASQLGISQEAAQQTLDQWQEVWQEGVERYEVAKQTAFDVAEEAKERTAQAALIAFVVMFLSLIAAVAGAIVGCLCAWKCERECRTEQRPGAIPPAV